MLGVMRTMHFFEISTSTLTQKRSLIPDRRICWWVWPTCLSSDRYDVYQQLMDYWDEVMQDEGYLITTDGWQTGRTLRFTYDKETPDLTIKRGQKTLKYVGEPVPASLVVTRFFKTSQHELGGLDAEVMKSSQTLAEFEEAHGPDNGALTGLEGKSGITKSNARKRALELKETIQKALCRRNP